MLEYASVSGKNGLNYVYWPDITNTNAIDIGSENGGPGITFMSYASAPHSSAESTNFHESNGSNGAPVIPLWGGLDSNYQTIPSFDTPHPLRPPDPDYLPSHVAADFNFSFDIATTRVAESISSQLDELATVHASSFTTITHDSNHAVHNDSAGLIDTDSSPLQPGPDNPPMEFVHRMARRFCLNLNSK